MSTQKLLGNGQRVKHTPDTVPEHWNGGLVWDHALGCMVAQDFCGMPVSRSCALAMRDLLDAHLKLSPAELAGKFNERLLSHPQWSQHYDIALPKDME